MILVTGGAGFIGSHFVDACIKAGRPVTIVDDLSTGFYANLNPAASFYEMDIRSPDLGGVFETEKPDVVVHLAAQMDVRHSIEDPLFDAETNVLGSVNVLERCVDSGDGETLNLGSGVGTSVGEVFAMLRGMLPPGPEPVLAPFRTGEVRDIYTTGDRALEVLGWSPRTGLQEGLRMTLDHIRKEISECR